MCPSCHFSCPLDACRHKKMIYCPLGIWLLLDSTAAASVAASLSSASAPTFVTLDANAAALTSWPEVSQRFVDLQSL